MPNTSNLAGFAEAPITTSAAEFKPPFAFNIPVTVVSPYTSNLDAFDEDPIAISASEVKPLFANSLPPTLRIPLAVKTPFTAISLATATPIALIIPSFEKFISFPTLTPPSSNIAILVSL